MKAKVTTKGLLIPKHLLEGVHEVDIRKENSVIVVVPLPPDDPSAFTSIIGDCLPPASLNASAVRGG